MPIKEFHCSCGNTFEHLLTRNEFDHTHQAPCPVCKHIAPAVEISTTGTPLLKDGSGGFYRPNA